MSVAVFGDNLWVGASGDAGLCKLDGTALESIKPNLTSVALEARGDSLMFCNTALVGDPYDGTRFKGLRVKGLANTVASDIPPWV